MPHDTLHLYPWSRYCLTEAYRNEDECSPVAQYVSEKDFTFYAMMQEYMKCLEKKDKYSARERTGPNVVKLENVRMCCH